MLPCLCLVVWHGTELHQSEDKWSHLRLMEGKKEGSDEDMAS